VRREDEECGEPKVQERIIYATFHMTISVLAMPMSEWKKPAPGY
jgi:hypothetical protein